MTTQEQIRKVTDIAQEKGWSISVEDENKTSIQFEFQRYTKYGQDFNFNADMQDEDINTLIAGMKRYYEDFDPGYEAYLWIGDDGHGRNGAPYHIKDIVSDMEEAEEQIRLRKEYVAAFRNNLRGTLETIKIQNPDGSIIDVKQRHDEKMKNNDSKAE